MAMVSLVVHVLNKKAEEGDKRYIRLLKVLESQITFYQLFKVGITLVSEAKHRELSWTIDSIMGGK